MTTVVCHHWSDCIWHGGLNGYVAATREYFFRNFLHQFEIPIFECVLALICGNFRQTTTQNLQCGGERYTFRVNLNRFWVVSHVDVQGRAGYEIQSKAVQTRSASHADVAGVRFFHCTSSLLTRHVQCCMSTWDTTERWAALHSCLLF